MIKLFFIRFHPPEKSRNWLKCENMLLRCKYYHKSILFALFHLNLGLQPSLLFIYFDSCSPIPFYYFLVFFFKPFIRVIQNFIQVTCILNYPLKFLHLAFWSLMKRFVKFIILLLIFFLNHLCFELKRVQFSWGVCV